jgi:hypothetical protein
LSKSVSLPLGLASAIPSGLVNTRDFVFLTTTRDFNQPITQPDTATTMPADYSPPDSPLSSVETDEGSGDDGHDYDEAARRPSKRQRLDAGSTTSSAVVPDAEPETVPEPDTIEGLSDVSSDTSGDIPSSPVNARLDDEDFQDQVTVCDWDGCPAGDLRDMDKLVEHIHNSHIENRQKKYTCEWRSCNRKGLPHASGYALKAHMRSHTREKPFYCYLPECDRSFTRSDALAKHMRTVHETEALRPSDPVPKSMQSGPTGKTGRLKIIIKTPQSHGQQDDDENGHGDETNPEYFTVLSEEIFDTEELAMPVDKLYRKSHWELKWAEEINESLKKECRELEAAYFKEWLEKEVLLSQVIKSEVDWHERRQAILTGLADVQVPKASEARDLDASAAAPTQTNGGDGEKKKSREREDDDEDEDEGRKEDKAEPLANGGKAASEVKAET